MGETVFVKNYGSGQRWLPGTIVQVTGPVSYQMKLEDGRLRRHQDQLRQRVTAPDAPTVSDEGLELNHLMLLFLSRVKDHNWNCLMLLFPHQWNNHFPHLQMRLRSSLQFLELEAVFVPTRPDIMYPRTGIDLVLTDQLDNFALCVSVRFLCMLFFVFSLFFLREEECGRQMYLATKVAH